MSDDEESRDARAAQLRPLVRDAVREPGSSLRKIAKEIGISHGALAGFLKPDRSSTPYDRTLDQVERWAAHRADGSAAPASRPAAELATILLDAGALVALLERLPPGHVLEAVYLMAREMRWGQDRIARLDAVAPALLRGATAAPVTGESRAELVRDALEIDRLVDRVAQRLAVIPPARTPGEQRRRPRAAQAHRGGQ